MSILISGLIMLHADGKIRPLMAIQGLPEKVIVWECQIEQRISKTQG